MNELEDNIKGFNLLEIIESFIEVIEKYLDIKEKIDGSYLDNNTKK